MIQSHEQENNNQFTEIYEQMMRSYFNQGKLYNFWKQQLPIIINNNIKGINQSLEFYKQQEEQEEQKHVQYQDQQSYTPQKDEIIFVGEKLELNKLKICQLQAKQLAPIHFKLLQSSQIFWLAWISLRRIFSVNIIRHIAQFSGFDCLDLIDISDPTYKSYIPMIRNIPFVLKSNRYKFCLCLPKEKFIYFKIRELEQEFIQNITVEQLLRKRIFYAGTKNFKIQNENICKMQKEITELQENDQNKAVVFLDFQQEYMNALLITANASFIKVLVVPNEQNNYQLSTDDDTFYVEFQKYSQILSMLKFINGNWQIVNDYLFKKLEKNQTVTIKYGRIITTSNNGMCDHQLIFDWKRKLILFNQK